MDHIASDSSIDGTMAHLCPTAVPVKAVYKQRQTNTMPHSVPWFHPPQHNTTQLSALATAPALTCSAPPPCCQAVACQCWTAAASNPGCKAARPHWETQLLQTLTKHHCHTTSQGAEHTTAKEHETSWTRPDILDVHLLQPHLLGPTAMLSGSGSPVLDSSSPASLTPQLWGMGRPDAACNSTPPGPTAQPTGQKMCSCLCHSFVSLLSNSVQTCAPPRPHITKR